MTINYSALTTGGTDTLGSSWNTASVAPADGAIVIAIASLFDAGGYFSALSVSGAGQTWTPLDTQGYNANLGNVAAAYCICDNPSSGALTLGTAGGQNYDAVAWAVIQFAPGDGEEFKHSQTLPFSTSNRNTTDTLTLQALAAQKARNITVSYWGAYNTSTEALTFSNVGGGWTQGAQSTSAAAAGANEIACGFYYAIDSTDTTASGGVNAASDRLFGGAVEFEWAPLFVPGAISILKD